ncbi:MAG: DUF5686 family protein [Crocinitomicaceae bacterium]
MMKNWLVFIALFLQVPIWSQKTGVVVDANTKEALPFVNIQFDDTKKGTVTNIDGKFRIEAPISTKLRFSFVGYENKIIEFVYLKDSVFLVPKTTQIGEVEVLAGENPALRIIRQASENRKKNDPERNLDFRIKSYSKYYTEGVMDSALVNRIEDGVVTDTSTLAAYKFMDSQYFFLFESVTETFHKSPNKTKKIVLGSKISGFKNPLINALFSQIQAFSYYKNSFSIFNTEYVNPLSPNSESRYIFIIEDTIVHSKDSTFIIQFFPRPKSNFNAMKGLLYINSENYALEKVITSPAQKIMNSEITIIQNYKKLENGMWFPFELKTEIEFGTQMVNINKINPNISFKGTTYITEFDFEPSYKGVSFSAINVDVEEDANEKDSLFWNAYRTDSITKKELKTYKVIDSVSQELKIEKRIETFSALLRGRIPIKFIDIDMMRIIDYNDYEGLRLGLGIYTNQNMLKWMEIGGYFGYGFKDKEWKYGGSLLFKVWRKKQFEIELKYFKDIVQRGGIRFPDKDFNLFSASSFYRFYIRNMLDHRYLGLRIGGLLFGNFKLNVVVNYQQRNNTDNYEYHFANDTLHHQNPYDIFEAGITFRWAIREKVIQLPGQVISMGTKWPTINAVIMRGFQGVIHSRYDYWRFNLSVDQEFNIRALGKILLQVNYAQILGNVPLDLRFVEIGTNSGFTIATKYAFEAMGPSEFYSDLSTNLFAYFEFKKIKTGIKFIQPQFTLATSAGWGRMKNQEYDYGVNYKTMEKGYFESGVRIDNLIKLNFLGLGFATYVRYGPYWINDKTIDNFAFKLALKFNLN